MALGKMPALPLEATQTPEVQIALIAFLLLSSLYAIVKSQLSSQALPVINCRKRFEFSDKKVKERYRANAKELLEQGLQKVVTTPRAS